MDTKCFGYDYAFQLTPKFVFCSISLKGISPITKNSGETLYLWNMFNGANTSFFLVTLVRDGEQEFSYK